ncbi:MAG TPA: hypothetical protein VFB35_06810 [Gaiellaceae bacterium]|nr:hypothetical protein [Gaiellaceae bacterium]
MRRAVAAAVLAAATVAPAATAAAPLRVHTSLDTATVRFGAVIQARVTVTAGPGVRTSSVRVVGGLAPLTTVSPRRVTRAGSTIETTRAVACITAPCVADGGVARPKLAPARVSAVLTDGRTVRVAAAWPPLAVRGRVTSADLKKRQPPFRASVVPPPPTYRVAPSTLARLFDGAAIALGLGALGLLGLQTRRRARRLRAGAPVDELERALRLAREAETRPVPDRRRAVGLLARLLDEGRAPLARSASELAWAKPQPEPDAVESLVGDIEQERCR